MELGRPLRTVTPTVDGDVLYVLARAEASFTPPQVHRLIGARSEDGVRRALVRLTEQGIVTGDRVGRAVEYRLNRDHLAAQAVLALATLRASLITRLRETISKWTTPTPYSALFGSAARGTMTPSSDIDLFVMRASSVDVDDAAWTDQVHELERAVRRWTGNPAQVLEYEESQFANGVQDTVLDEIIRDGVHLTGPPGYLRRTSRSR